METGSAAVSSRLFADRELLDLLGTEEDRILRPIVDEFVARGERMVGPLTRICRDEMSWRSEAAWAAIHASFILGAIGTEKALPGLLAALGWASRLGVDCACDALPAIFGGIGRAATAPLKVRLLDRTAPAVERALALDALAAVAARTPIEQGEILDFFRLVAEDEGEREEVRVVASYALLRFLRPGDRSLILSAAIRQEWGDGLPLFTRSDVDEAYARRRRDLDSYLRDWLDFYSPAEVERRARLRREAAEDARWARGVRERASWVDEQRAQFLRRFEWSLVDLDDVTRGDAVWVAESMTEYLAGHERRAPWRWNGATAFAYLMDVFARRVALDSPGRIRVVPENLLRVVRFCEAEGRLSEEERREVEECVGGEADEFVAAAYDPAQRRAAREMIRRLLANGVDPADRKQTTVFLARGAKPQAPSVEGALELPDFGRNGPCPCGSARRFRLCCGK
jgi:hypothetical protein